MASGANNKNYEGVQALRFIAAFLVVLTHATFYASDRMTLGNGYWPGGASGVNIFFVISGFVMVVSTLDLRGTADGWWIFAHRRIIRIVPLYWIATTIKLLALFLVPTAILHSGHNILHIVSSYLFIPTANVEGEFKPLLAVGWTLYFEMFFYAMFAVALFLNVDIYGFVGGILTVVSILSVFRTPTMPAAAMFLDPIVLQFFFGMLVAWSTGTLRDVCAVPAMSMQNVLSAALVASGLIMLLAPFDVPGVPEAARTGIPSTLIVFGIVRLEPLLKGRIPKWLLVLGDSSYALYIFHPLIAPVVPTLLKKLDVQHFTASVLVSATLSILSGLAIHLLLERPLTRRLRALKSLSWRSLRLKQEHPDVRHVEVKKAVNTDGTGA